MRSLLSVVILFVALATNCTQAHAASFFVSPDGTSTYPTIQDAVDEAVAGDVIYLLDGTFTGPGNRDVTVPVSVTIRSNDVFNPVTIDCEGSDLDPHQGFHIVNGAPHLEYLTVINGYANYGGAVRVSGGTVTLLHCQFENNTATQNGGGFYSDSGEVETMDHCVFSENTAGGTGGAICGESDTQLMVQNCTLFRNDAPDGSGVYLLSGATCDLNSSIVAFGLGGPALSDYYGGGYVIGCTDMFANQGGDWIGAFAGMELLNNNANIEPLFCDPMGHPANYALVPSSPVGNAYVCGALGAKLPDDAWTAPVFGVAADGTGMYPTIQAAHDAAPDESTIALEDGIYTGPGNRDLVWSRTLVSLAGRSQDATQVVIDAQGSAADPHRAMNIVHDGEYASRRMEYITFRNGYADGALGDSGGAVMIGTGAFVVFERCRFEDNSAAVHGGAVASDGANLIVLYSHFVGNVGEEAIRAVNSAWSFVVQSCTFEGDSGHIAAIGSSSSADFSFRYNQFSPGSRPNILVENVAREVGIHDCSVVAGHPYSGLRVVDSADVRVSSSTFSPSTSTNPPPPVTAINSTVHFLDSTFNVSEPGAAGSCAVSGTDSHLSLDNCSFTGYHQNSGYNGVVNVAGGSLTADGCTFTDNFLGIHVTGLVSPGVSVTNTDFEYQSTACLYVAGTTLPVMVDGCQFNRSGKPLTFIQAADCSILNSTITNTAIEDNSITLLNAGCDIRTSSFTDNSAMYAGGVISSMDSNLNLDGCEFLRNFTHSSLGGGVLGQSGGYTSITNCTMNDNSSDSQGGAIRVDAGALTVYTSGFAGNQSETQGGAIMGLNSTIHLEGCVVENNTGSQGGGVNVESGNLVDLGSTFRDNTASWGGGVSGYLSEMTLGSSTITGNTADSYGGVYMNQCLPAVMDHCLVAGNTTHDRGSGIDAFACDPAISNCTISGNGGLGSTAQVVFEGACDAVLDGNIIAFGLVGPALSLTSPEWCTLTVDCCDVFGNAAGDWVGDLAGLDATSENFSTNPLFCDPDAGDFHLAEASDCATANSACAGDIGAFGVGCLTASPVFEEGELPRSFAVLGNVPNPFNPRTQIHFELAVDGPVVVDVYDVAGRRVRRLANGEIRMAGQHEVTWDGADDAGRGMSSGVYMYQVTAQGRTLGGRMTLLR